jgi:hypothetical protein
MDNKEQVVVDPIAAILAATFGPDVGAEVAAEPVDAPVEVVEAEVPSWWKRNQDGSLRKTSQAPVFTGLPKGVDAKSLDTDRRVLGALLAGAETLVEVTAQSGFARLTVRRSLERLLALGLVVMTKAPPTGKRGRRAFLYRALVVEADPTSADADVVDPDLVPTSTGVDVVDPDPVPPAAEAAVESGVEG